MYVTVIELNESIWVYFFLQFTSEVLIVEKKLLLDPYITVVGLFKIHFKLQFTCVLQLNNAHDSHCH